MRKKNCFAKCRLSSHKHFFVSFFFGDSKSLETRARSLQIHQVRNGAQASELQGGPYALYVRWSPPSHTAEESRQIQKRQLDELRTQLKNGEGNVTEESLRILELNAEKRRVFMNYGLGPISAKDR